MSEVGTPEPLAVMDISTEHLPAQPGRRTFSVTTPARHDENPFGELTSSIELDAKAERERDVQASVQDPILRALPLSRKIAFTAACSALLIALPYTSSHPISMRLRVLSARSAPVRQKPVVQSPTPERIGEVSLPGPTLDAQHKAQEFEQAPRDTRSPIAHHNAVKVMPPVMEDKPPRSIEDPSGHALDAFFAKLMRAEAKQPDGTVRILYYGDSIIASDFITGKLRRLLQSRFGDAGHGYALIANAFPGWFHIDISRTASANWKASRCVGPFAEDGLYGLGCVSFHAREPDAWFRFATTDSPKDPWGKQVTSFELEFQKQPGGGSLKLLLDDKEHETIATDNDTSVLSYHKVRVPEGAHSLEVRTVDSKPVRLFGMRMERDVPGVTLSAMGITGARAHILHKADEKHFAQALASAKPDLVVLAFGSNETTDGLVAYDDNGVRSREPMKLYEERLRKLMVKVKTAVPNASVMLSGPPDMASADERYKHSRSVVRIYSEAQRKVAKEQGWAFWDQFSAMGGAGSMWQWIKRGWGSTDMFHPTGIGGNILGRMEYLAMMQAFEVYKKEQAAKPKTQALPNEKK
jgi:lysophospholipase L1-like esterase